MDLILVHYKEFGNTSLGLVLKDVGGETEFLSQKLNLPMSVGVGVGHKFGNFTLIRCEILRGLQFYWTWWTIRFRYSKS